MVPLWCYNGTMPASLSIKNVPDDVVERLRARAARNRRSLQGELLDLIERAADEIPTISTREVYDRIRKLNLPAGESSATIIRAMRDAR
jgi:plasmid stability protein